jgi:hypothetical protein
MKKLFTMMVVSLCGTMAYAQTAISVKDVTIAKGGTTNMEVVVNNPSNYTAFQFDLKLPKGVSVKDAKMNGSYGDDRKFEKKCVDEGNNIYRFLSYDMKNAGLTGSGTVANITLEAASDVAEGELEASETAALVVTPAGDPTDVASAVTAKINVAEGVEIEFPEGGKTTFVSAKDLDFSGLTDVKAYIISGYDLASGSIWLTRVKDVPAKTPIWVSGPKSKKQMIPVGTSITYYPDNFLVGSATESIDIPAESDDYLNWTLGKDGSVAKRTDGIKGFPAGKAYLHLPKKANSVAGSTQSIELTASGNKRAYVTPCDLDFSDVEGMKAYIVTGFAKGGTIWLTRVSKVSANTPVYLKGTEKGPFSVPASEVKIVYANMLKGDATNATALKAVDGDYTNCVLSKADGVFNPLGGDVASFPAGTSYLSLLTSYLTAASRGNGVLGFTEEEAEVMVIGLRSIEGDGDATAINRVAAQPDKDVWYNLNGQRIDTPTKKGLYIKNGKKVIVK